MELTRYEYGDGCMEPNTQGEYIKYDDFIKLFEIIAGAYVRSGEREHELRRQIFNLKNSEEE